MLIILASILSTLTGQSWHVLMVHGVLAICQLATVHGQVYANGCFR